MADEPDKPEHTDTGVHSVRDVFGESWRIWVTVKRQFTPTSLTIIAAIIAAAGGWIVHMHEQLARQDTRIVVLETEVVPVVKGSEKLEALDHRLTTLEEDFQVCARAGGYRSGAAHTDAAVNAGNPGSHIWIRVRRSVADFIALLLNDAARRNHRDAAIEAAQGKHGAALRLRHQADDLDQTAEEITKAARQQPGEEKPP